MLARKVFFKDREMKNERLEITDQGSLYFLGPNLVLRQCTLVLKVPASRLLFKGVQFIDCTFEVKQELKNHQDWIGASLKGCQFKGRFSGCDFGHWPQYSDEPWHQSGSIENCDFTEAHLDGCRFMGCDPSTLSFPKWPCFTFLDPIGRSPEFNSVAWPGDVDPILIETLRKQPPNTVALTEHALCVAKRYGPTPEELRAVLERFDGIIY